MKKSNVRLIAGILLGAILMGWFLWTVPWPEFTASMASVRLPHVVLAALLLFAEFLIRALRWRLLVRPVAPEVSLFSLWSASLVGAAMNTILPARAGEIARALVAVRRTGAPVTAVVTTNVLERVFDLIGLLTVFLLALIFLPSDSGPEGELVDNLRRYGSLFGAAGIMGLLTLAWVAWHQGGFLALVHKGTRWLPERIAAPFTRLINGVTEGLLALRSGKAIIGCVGLTLVLWLNGALAIYLLFFAFRLPLPFGAACFTSVAIALTVVLPQAPGFVGVFHVAVEKTLVLWGMDAAPSKAFAVVFWFICFVPPAMAGLVALWHEGLTFGELMRPKDRPV